MIRNTILMSALLTACLTSPAFAGAFGVLAGTPVSKLSVVKLESSRGPTSEYQITVPDPDPEFDKYYVIVSAATGVCKVLAMGKAHTNDDNGNSIIPAFSTFQSNLSKIYGEPKTYDYISSQSKLTSDSDFAAALATKDRTLKSFWNGAPTLPTDDTLGYVYLLAGSNNSHDTFLMLSYEFSNFSDCTKGIVKPS